jgi:glutamate racemase
MNEAPIGIFDSGIGGLTVASSISKAFPNESILYFGDTAHLPYGEKSVQSIQKYSLEIADFLLEKGCKMLVIACNTASAAAYELLSEKYSDRVPVVDVISPLVELIASKNFSKVGVMATKATVRSDVYNKKINQLNAETEVVSLATGLLASMIEEGFFNNDISRAVLHKYLTYPDFEDIDALLLACTHYPLIKPEIEDFYGEKVQVFDSVDAVTARVGKLLEEKELFNTLIGIPEHRFFVSDFTQSFENTTRFFYQKEVQLEVANFD